MKPTDLSREERDALALVRDEITYVMTERPKAATRKYYTCETTPEGVLMPEHIRSILKVQLRGLARAEELEAFAAQNIRVAGVAFEVWEANPGAVHE